MKRINIDLTEEEHIKFKELAKNNRQSLKSYCMSILIDKHLKEQDLNNFGQKKTDVVRMPHADFLFNNT